MDTWTMISVTYSRLPKTTSYLAEVKIDQVQKEGEQVRVLKKSAHSMQGVPMEQLIEDLHRVLQSEPEPHKVTMFRVVEETPWSEAMKKGYKLDDAMVKTLKEDLQKAQELFAPVIQVCDVRPFVPTLKEEN